MQLQNLSFSTKFYMLLKSKRIYCQFLNSQKITTFILNFTPLFSVSRIHPRELSFSKDRVKMAFILCILSPLPPPVQLLTLAKEFRFHNGMHASDTLLYAQ
ncbi:hypothetical protein Pint_19345 [Pistacia integerrima]|uniref:Uncharacterized protein n=1 Tax=Pistacia integerrima TaxID=434235 RepID=A0ACC0YTZ5_9ROSI|nr:hypothetical protein Pint_19345 [Pistacia integerrima]